jgi:hypothetical protein
MNMSGDYGAFYPSHGCKNSALMQVLALTEIFSRLKMTVDSEQLRTAVKDVMDRKKSIPEKILYAFDNYAIKYHGDLYAFTQRPDCTVICSIAMQINAVMPMPAASLVSPPFHFGEKQHAGIEYPFVEVESIETDKMVCKMRLRQLHTLIRRKVWTLMR